MFAKSGFKKLRLASPDLDSCLSLLGTLCPPRVRGQVRGRLLFVVRAADADAAGLPEDAQPGPFS